MRPHVFLMLQPLTSAALNRRPMGTTPATTGRTP
jgi:hypothetical protein